jgi:hypothetical protein
MGVYGGGVLLGPGSIASFFHNTFAGNMAAMGSAVLVQEGASLELLKSCNFYNNTQLVEYPGADGFGTIDPIRVFTEHAFHVYAERCAQLLMCPATDRWPCHSACCKNTCQICWHLTR